VNYEIHVALGPDVKAGKPTVTYQFTFSNTVKNPRTILRSFTGVIQNVNDAAQNFVQKYDVTRIDRRLASSDPNRRLVLGTGLVVPPNNQGKVTPLYNQSNNGDMPAKPGVASADLLDPYTKATLHTIGKGHRVFAGQRDDGFYADVQSVFDLLNLRTTGSFDSQSGFNVHTIVLNIPVSELGGDNQVVGVYAATNRAPLRIISVSGDTEQEQLGLRWAQVGRQGNPLFCEALVAVEDKDKYSRTTPENDATVFRKYAESPELARLLNSLNFDPGDRAVETGRTDLSAIFIPDLIKTDLSTSAARLAGAGKNAETNADDAGFSRLSVFGDPPDLLTSRVQNLGPLGRNIPGGWPNGRRFGDDVLDIAIVAILSDLRPVLVPGYTATPLEIDRKGDDVVDIDRVKSNDIAYNKVFPYASTPLNGRNHEHD
jgi:hypothetical protein